MYGRVDARCLWGRPVGNECEPKEILALTPLRHLLTRPFAPTQLTNHFEDDPTAFYEVSAGLILLTSVVGGLGIRALRKISRAGLGSLARIATRR